jgi:hypothetical protein
MPLDPCDCGQPGAIQICVADPHGLVLDTVVLCAECANARVTG